MKKNQYLTIHGHFYQPPIENPWTEAIEQQESAAPYHNWNEKIASECYRPNSVSRILDSQRRIADIVNNYERVSFNFGPTLLSWLEKKVPETYQAIIDADRKSIEKFSGHGNAIAQAYNHIILPLANHRDKITQIKWGLADFEYRFGRQSESIWLPETAINHETLEVLIVFAFKFLILSPYQAKRVRPLDAKNPDQWKDVSDGSIDVRHPYRCFLIDKKGKKDTSKYIDIFFCHGELSKAVGFEHTLRDAKIFTSQIQRAYLDNTNQNQLISICTDGESYGHHEPFGDMALAYLLYVEAEHRNIQITNYAEFLDKNPPQWEVELKEGPNGAGTAWSCFHGVGRWYRDCGCQTDGKPGWNQKWREPLKKSCYVKSIKDKSEYEHLKSEVKSLFCGRKNQLLKSLQQNWIDGLFSLQDMLFEEREEFFEIIMRVKMKKLHQIYQKIYAENENLFQIMFKIGIPMPQELKIPAETTLSAQLVNEVENSKHDFDKKFYKRTLNIVEKAEKYGFQLNKDISEKTINDILYARFQQLYHQPDVHNCAELIEILEITSNLKIAIKEGQLQDIMIKILKQKLPGLIVEIVSNNMIDEQYQIVTGIIQLAYRLNFSMSSYKEKLLTIDKKMSEDPNL